MTSAVSVTEPLLEVCPAGIVSGPLTVNTSSIGAVVTVVAALDGWERLAVIVVLFSSTSDVSASSTSWISVSGQHERHQGRFLVVTNGEYHVRRIDLVMALSS